MDNLGNMALFELADGNFDQAISFLEEAASKGGNAQIYNDLAVAYIDRYQHRRQPFDLIISLNAAVKASEMDHQLPEVLFNKALILQLLFLRGQAKEAWRKYLGVNEKQGWPEAARAWLATLEQPTLMIQWSHQIHSIKKSKFSSEEIEGAAARFPQWISRYVEEDLIPAWAMAHRSANYEEAGRLQREILIFASALARSTGDRLLYDEAVVLKSSNRRRLDLLASAYLKYKQARGVAGTDVVAAERLFLAASLELGRLKSRFHLWAIFRAAVCKYQSQDYRGSLRLISAMPVQGVNEDYSNFNGHLAWLSGLAMLETGDASSAFESFRDASRHFQKARAVGHQAAVQSLAAHSLSYMGESLEAWKFRYCALRAASLVGDPDRESVIFNEAARALSEESEHKAAVVFKKEVSVFELGARDPIITTEALWRRAIVYYRAGDLRSALKDIGAARQYSMQILDPAKRRHAFAGILSVEAAVKSSLGDNRSALEALSRALDIYRASKFQYSLIDIYLRRARILNLLGDAAGAERDLELGIREHEHQSSLVGSSRAEPTAFGTAQDLFDELLKLKILGRRDTQAGFEICDRAKSSDGPRQALKLPAKPSALIEKVSRQLDEHSAVVVYRVLDDRTFAWIVTGGAFSFLEMRVGSSELRGLIDSFLASIENPLRNDFEGQARVLFRLLIDPLGLKRLGVNRLIIVPDESLYLLPFAALQDNRSKRFLFQDYVLSIIPSVSMYLRLVRGIAAPQASEAVTAISIGDPDLGARYAYLGALPQARIEAEAVASLFPGSVLLTGGQATRSRFISEIGSHAIIHFAGHALLNPQEPLLSRLLLSTQVDSGELFARDIAGLRLNDTRLVVLSACDSGGGRYTDLRGVMSISRSFLLAGVPAVVASQWKLSDEGGREFFANFYRSLHGGADVASSIQGAQLAMLNAENLRLRNPLQWASFQLLGVPVSVIDRKER
jgi:CHAT domain-containing protein